MGKEPLPGFARHFRVHDLARVVVKGVLVAFVGLLLGRHDFFGLGFALGHSAPLSIKALAPRDTIWANESLQGGDSNCVI